jgi:hypothetical protein
VAAVVDVADNASVASAEPGVVTDVADELDSRSDRDAGSDPSRKELRAVGVHDVHIGFDAQELDPFVGKLWGRRPYRSDEVAGGRRTAPNSTA